METDRTKTITYSENSFEFANYDRESDDVETRLKQLLILERQTELENSIYRDENERFEASLLENPLTTEQAIKQFGLLLGTFPPMALFGSFIIQNARYSDDLWIIPLLSFVNFICALTGYFSGKLIAKMVKDVENWRWMNMIAILPFIGILWGILTGGAGGLFIFGIGAIFGAIVAALVGGVALPVFTIFHRLFKKGDLIDKKQFLPIAFGITFIITAFFLGLNIR